MEILETTDSLEIENNKIFYDKKTEVLSIYIFDFVFIGNYKKSTRLSKILDDLYNSFGEISRLSRENILIVDFVTHSPIRENTKLKNLKLMSKREAEKKKKKPIKEKKLVPLEDKEKKKAKKAPMIKSEAKEEIVEKSEDVEFDFKGEEILNEELIEEAYFGESRRMREPEPKPSIVPAAPKAAPPPPPAPGAVPARTLMDDDEAVAGLVTEPPKPTVYEINMGLQYYSVMMEQMSYLFYVYFSHKELKIVDEEGKTVFETTIRIETLKKEPPILNLRVEGEGFEVHPFYGRVEVKKDAVNPPVMIFSILPIKNRNKTKTEKKEGERRFLHVYIDYEEKTINHTILSIIVQPKHFHLDIGPIHLNVSKKVAAIISFLSIIIAVTSLIFTIFSIDTSSTFVDVVTNFAPGLGSIVFIAIFLITLFKEGIYPLKEKISYFLNFDKTGMLIK